MAQQAGGLVGRRSIERHQRRRDPWNPDDARAPSIVGDSSDLDQIRVSADQFLEAMNSYAHGEGAACVWESESGMNCTPASPPIKRNEGRRLASARQIRKDASGKQFGLSGLPQEMDGSSTGFQHPRRYVLRLRTGRRLVTAG
jgi:hypothetical protein